MLRPLPPPPSTSSNNSVPNRSAAGKSYFQAKLIQCISSAIANRLWPEPIQVRVGESW